MKTAVRVLVDARWVSAAPASSHARYMRALARQWADLANAPYLTLIGAGPRPPDLVTSERVSWHTAPDLPGPLRRRPGGRLWLNTIFTAISVIKRPQVLFFPWSVLPRVLVAPAVVTVHDICFRSQAAAFRDGGRRGDEQVRASVRSAAAVLTPSAESKRGIVAAYGVEPERVTVVRHGVEAVFNPLDGPSDEAARRALGLASPYFLTVSTHEERKNLDVLVRAYVALVRGWSGQGEPPALVFVGKNSPHTQVLRRELATSAAATQRTHFIENVSDAVLAALYRGARAVLLPSLCEGFGFPLVEALACGTPAIVSDLPVFHELVGDSATYVAPHDVSGWTAAMAQLMADPLSRVRSQSGASNVSTRLSWQNSAIQTLEVLERVARLPHAPRRHTRNVQHG